MPDLPDSPQPSPQPPGLPQRQLDEAHRLEATTALWEQGRQLGELGIRLSIVEKRLETENVVRDERYAAQEKRLDRVVLYVDHQNQLEAVKKASAEERDKELRVIKEGQRQLSMTLVPILGAMLVALVALLATRIIQDVPREVAYAVLGVGVVFVGVILYWAFARARLLRVTRDGGSGHW